MTPRSLPALPTPHSPTSRTSIPAHGRRGRSITRMAGALLCGLALAAPAAAQKKAPASGLAPDAYGTLDYRYIGPEGNRVTSVAGVPGDRTTYYAGAASGGVFRTTDGGVHWQPVFDKQDAMSIGALAVAPSDPQIVWAGTGEPFIRSHISVGNGVYRSTDGGTTWKRMGLEESGRIGRIAIDPGDPDVVFVAVLGHAYAPQSVRGLWRTRDGGGSWEKVLFVNDSTGFMDVVLDPSNPRIVYAASWQLAIHTWGRESGGAGSGIWKSTDGGTTWERLTKGLPDVMGKIGLAVPAADPSRVYALIEAGDGVPYRGKDTKPGKLWRSDNAGESWRMVNADRELGGRGAYYTRMGVSPDDPDEAYFLSASFSKTLDGGMHTIDLPFQQQPAGDHHDIWIDPTNGNRMIVSSDGGVSISENRGATWLRVQLPVAQIYHVTVDNAVPYRVYGNRQDGPSMMGPSNTRTGAGFGSGIARGDWSTVGGGESGWATPDTVDGNLVWSSASGFGSVSGIVTRYDRRTREVQSVEVWPLASIGWPAKDVKYRFNWDFPLTISPHDHNTVYVGSQYVHRTTDGGRTWPTISPDLTRNDTSRMGFSGGLTGDNIGVEYAGVVYGIAESPVQKGLIWAGTNDGLLHVTRDDGATWTDVTKNLPGLPEWVAIRTIEPSRWDAGTAYVAADGHQVGIFEPLLYRTTDFGKTFTRITTGIPSGPLSYTHVIRQDLQRRGMLYAGTENGLYVSFDDGDHWQPLQNNLPHAPVYDVVVQPRFRDLVVATYGRGFWILDDVTPLEQLTPDVAAEPAHLFAPREAWRFRGAEAIVAPYEDPSAGQNPKYGATLAYWLKAAADDSVALSIADASGAVVRTLKGPSQAGVNRVQWDLRGEPTTEVRMRTTPIGAPYVELNDQGWRPSPDIGRLSVLVPPGMYTLTMKAGDASQSRTLAVRKDPYSAGSEADIAAQAEVMDGLRSDLETVARTVNRIELLRAQLRDLGRVLEADSATAEKAAADSLDTRLMAIEEELAQLRQSGRGQDVIRWPARAGFRIGYLADEISASDLAPTEPQKQVAALLHETAVRQAAALDAFAAGDLAAFNERLRGKGMGAVATGGR